ncbi:MAG: septal ring lytic transglycosylase RlpA family protein [Candidatus Acidiferrales bacterium]
MARTDVRANNFTRSTGTGKRKRWFHLSLLFAAVAALAGCAHHPAVAARPVAVPGTTSSSPSILPPTVGEGWGEEGVASWYGPQFNGHRTSNGEIYDMYAYTAAHRTLPFNTVVRVTNLNNSKQVEVRINDRGPFVANRVIDLSLSAAQAIEMVGTGTAPVRIEIVSGSNVSESPETVQEGFFTVQVGAFQLEENAQRLRDRLAARYDPVTVDSVNTANGMLFRVRVGHVASLTAAQQLAQEILESDQLSGMVIRLDN